MNRLLIFAGIALMAAACSTSGERSKEYLPKSTGKPGDLLLVMDSVQWNGTLGDTARSIFQSEVPGLPREEAAFNVIYFHPDKNMRLLNQVRNIVYIFSLDQKTNGSKTLKSTFTPETIAKIQSDTSFFFYTDEDVFALNQKVMYLFGATEKQLIRHLKQHGKEIIEFFNLAERKRLEKALFSGKATKNISSFLKKEQQFEIQIPSVGYKLAQKENDFVWFRNIEANADRDIFITWKKYESEYQFLPDSLIAWRDATAKKYLYEDPENPISYLVTEQSVPWNPVRARQVALNGHYAMELRGLWKTNNHTMGGPFVSYSLVDQAKGLIYYIEGFTYSPGKPQREAMRELETVLWTFRMSDEIDK